MPCSLVIFMPLRVYILIMVDRSCLLCENLCICYVHIARAMLLCFTLMIKTTCFYVHETNLTVDQVPPNRALFVQPQLPVRAGLDAVYRWASLMRVTKEGRLRAAISFGRVN